MRVLLLCLLALVATAARADDAELKQKIVGTWKLVSVVYEDQESKARTPVYGEHPRGRQIATADGIGSRWSPPRAGPFRRPMKSAHRRCAP